MSTISQSSATTGSKRTSPSPSSPKPPENAQSNAPVSQEVLSGARKPVTKAERRAVQEAQRAAKAGKPAGGQPKENASKEQKKAVSNKGPESPRPGPTLKKPANSAADKSGGLVVDNRKGKQVSLFQHIDYAKGADTASAYGTVHPVILALGVQFAAYKICGANARTIATLQAFRKVIEDYHTPPNQALSRHLLTHLSPQIQFLVNSRPMGVGMGNAIRFLKHQIVTLNPDMPEEDAKEELSSKLDGFIRERITAAGQVIAQNGADNIRDGDVIMTFARSSVVQNVILTAHKRGVKFEVVCVDSRPRYEGRNLLRTLADAGVTCYYAQLNAAGGSSPTVRDVTKVFLGAHALLSNGALYSRVGTASIAMAAKDRNIPVIVCCEVYKFTDRVQLDSIVVNELASPDEMINISVKQRSGDASQDRAGALAKWKDESHLKLLNLMYDVTPPEFITMVLTEVGSVPVSSVPVILREYRYAN